MVRSMFFFFNVLSLSKGINSVRYGRENAESGR